MESSRNSPPWLNSTRSELSISKSAMRGPAGAGRFSLLLGKWASPTKYRAARCAGVTFLTHLECGMCGARHEADRLQNLCAKCGNPLLARYDVERAKERVSRAAWERGEDTLWRF